MNHVAHHPPAQPRLRRLRHTLDALGAAALTLLGVHEH
jgi:hypothetical protein